MSNAFAPHVAVVTGAGQGIGREVALRLAADGLDVVVNDIPSNSSKANAVAGEIQAMGRRAVSVLADVSVEAQVKSLIDQATAELGGVDVMVANAGIAFGGPVAQMDVAAWDNAMAINVRGTMLCYKYAAQQMIKQGRGGRIIGASSAHGKKGAANFSAYSASKFAIRGLTQSAAQELAEHGITVNAYAPGIILTPMTISDADKQFGGQEGDALAAALNFPGCPRAGPDVVASVVSYLVKPEAYFITGQSLSVNGGVFMD